MSTALKVICIYYLLINIILFLTMGIDKARAQKEKWRVPESSLFIMALLGGAIGGFAGMFLFHHKNRKPQFYIIYLISLILHGAVIYLLITKLILK